QGAYHQGGEPAARAALADIPELSALFSLTVVLPATSCSGVNDIGLSDAGGCLRLVASDAKPDWADRFLPLLLPILAGLIISIPASMLLAQRFAAPLRIVGAGMSDLAQGDLRRRISGELVGSDAEVAALGQAFDRAAARLQNLSDSRERLFHDISHELRSPLARLHAALGLLSVSPNRLGPMLQRMGTDIDRMSGLLEELLTLARIENTEPQPHDWQDIDLIDLLDPIIADANFERQSQGISCHLQGPDSLILKADPELLHRAFENVIRNALKFTQDGSTIEVSAEEAKGTITLCIEDRGIGADPSEIPGLFTPFVRGTRAPERAGSGLGLAIAARAIAVHQGQITAENRLGGGLTVRIVLPRSTQPGQA
ncbi:MAG: HAMP domain-containing histidine kinase, partial [Rhodobacteraceae bacterium]|nr:HAMP domain-containing histidine kinase [Paracoccaceae bacterium]